MKAKLFLIPTPIDDQSPLEPVALALLNKAVIDKDIIAVEDPKPGRRRWLNWGLPREAIENFVHYNEHSRDNELSRLIDHLKNGKNVFLMSDGGLPAFCDPGVELVNTCHNNSIEVTSTPFCNSIALAVALSGFKLDEFIFCGFIPAKKDDREEKFNKLKKESRSLIIMDTPYRLGKTIEDVTRHFPDKKVFLALNLNHPNQELLRGKPSLLQTRVKGQKAEFILIISQ
ncbi:MAG: 16S rRNA (cytidine1402-2'-O)-methyltransferase [Bacteriovoracaceae bacterium]|jgi:16S rRNA (cytidine1402-2'-O)-methyltransferase